MTPLVALGCHFIGDFAFQSPWMAGEKGKNWEILAYHSATYAAPFMLMGANTMQTLFLFWSHMAIDPLKSRWKLFDKIWIDQALHIIVLAIVMGGGN